MDITNEIKELSGSTVTKKHMVELFGSDKLKDSFKKYNKIKSGDRENALIRTMEQYFESVEKVRVGRSIQYQLGNAYDTVQKREDYRANNGGYRPENELPSTKYMETLLYHAFKKDILYKGMQYEGTLNNWLYNFGLVNENMYVLRTAYNSKKGKKVINDINGKPIKKTEYSRIKDEYDRQKFALQRLLENMRDNGVISFDRIPRVVYKNGNKAYDPKNPDKLIELVSNISVDDKTASMIINKHNEFYKKHSVTGYQTLNNDRNSNDVNKKVNKCENDINEYYDNNKLSFTVRDIGEDVTGTLEYLYFSYSITIEEDGNIDEYFSEKRSALYRKYNEDPEEFIKEVKEEYKKTFMEIMMQNALDTKGKVLDDLSIKDDIKGHKYYWENLYIPNLIKLSESLQPDFIQDLSKEKNFNDYKDTINVHRVDKESLIILMEEELQKQ